MNVVNQIHELETSFDVASIQVKRGSKSFQIYPWIKAKLFYKQVVGKESLAQKNNRMLLKQLVSFFYGFSNLFKKYDAWAFSNADERISIEGKYYDKIYDGFNELKNFKCLLIELQLFKKYKRKDIHSKYIASKAFFMIQEEIYSRVFVGRVHIENKELINQISTQMNVDINAEKVVRKVLSQYRVMKFWLKMLPNPKVVFLTVGYANYGYILAFKERNIPVIEMQHGVVSEGHQGYNYQTKLDACNFPDALAVWGENEKDFITNKSLIPIDHVFILGRSVIDYYLKTAVQNNSINKICVSLQDGEISDRLIKLLLESNDLTGAKNQFYLQTRRTTELAYRSKFLFPENFIFFKGNIYENIAQSDVHITVYSTSGLESLSLGKPAIFVDFDGKAKEVFSNQLGDNPYCMYISKKEELVNLLDNYSVPRLEEVRKESAKICAINYKEKLESLINSYR